MTSSGRKLAKRACDGCKIRKIKCTEVAPCEGCVAAGIACTFIKPSSTRGPRRLRKSTLREITQSQQQWEDLGFGSQAPDEPVVHDKLDAESVFAPNKVAALVLQLCVYRLRMYPVWPIIKVERLVASLQKPEPDIEVFGLAYAVAAATIAQIRSKPSTQPGAVTAEMMEAQCQYAKVRRDKSQPPDLTTIRIPFFLHMYYENLEPGGLQSITYLREAIAIAHMIGLHRETYYSDVQPEEREIRRRTLWLLFVAERNVSVSHKLPVTVRTKIAFPSTIDSDSEHVLLAYQKLVTMFWHFDRSGIFELLDRHDFEFAKATRHRPSPALLTAMMAVRKKLDDNPVNTDNMEDTQAVDLLITRQWMRMILWRVTTAHEGSSPSSDNLVLVHELTAIAKDLIAEISHTPGAAIEAHSSSFETKVFDIAQSLLDMVRWQTTAVNLDTNLAQELSGTVHKLQSCLNRNEKLHGLLNDSVTDLQQKHQLAVALADTDLSAAVIEQWRISGEPSIDSSPSTRASQSPGASLLSESQIGAWPDPSVTAQDPSHRSWYMSPNPVSTTAESQSVDFPLQDPYLDMDWNQFEQSPGTALSESSSYLNEGWRDVQGLYNRT